MEKQIGLTIPPEGARTSDEDDQAIFDHRFSRFNASHSGLANIESSMCCSHPISEVPTLRGECSKLFKLLRSTNCAVQNEENRANYKISGRFERRKELELNYYGSTVLDRSLIPGVGVVVASLGHEHWKPHRIDAGRNMRRAGRRYGCAAYYVDLSYSGRKIVGKRVESKGGKVHRLILRHQLLLSKCGVYLLMIALGY